MKNLKISTLCIALGVLSLNLVACDKADKKADTPANAQSTTVKTEATSATSTTATTVTTSTTATTVVASAPTITTSTTTSASSSTALTATNSNTIAASATIDQVMSIMGSSMAMANKMTQQSEGKPKFTNDQINCVASTGNDVATADMQDFLQKNFTPTEMKQMNDYFGSSTGKKQAEMTKTMMEAVIKDPKTLPKIDISDKEKKDMNTFWQSPTGTKLGAILKNKEKLSPVMTKIMSKKQVDCNLPKAETSAKPATGNAKPAENKAK